MPPFSEVELDSAIDYSMERGKLWQTIYMHFQSWIIGLNIEQFGSYNNMLNPGWLGSHCSTAAARQEIHFLTGRMPGDFFKFSSSFWGLKYTGFGNLFLDHEKKSIGQEYTVWIFITRNGLSI